MPCHARPRCISQPAKWIRASRSGRRLSICDPYEDRYYFGLAQELLQLQKFQLALETLDTGVKIFDKSAQLQLARGVALYGLRRFPESIDAFLLTIRLAPDVEQPYVFLGRMLDVAESKLPAVTEVLSAYSKSQPNNPMSSLLYAKALAAGSGDAEKIETLLRQSIKLNDALWEVPLRVGTDFGKAAQLRRSSARV